MSTILDPNCLNSVVRSTYDKRAFFGFLPPHGVWLDPDEEYEFPGDLRVSLGDPGLRSATGGRLAKGLRTALEEGKLAIVRTPNPLLLDADSGETKMLTLDDDSLLISDPCWFSSEGDE